MEKSCEYCGNAFEGNAKARFCSSTHRVLAHRQKHGQLLTPFLQLNNQATELARVQEAYKALELRVQALDVENEELRAQLLVERATSKPEPLEVTPKKTPIKAAKKSEKNTYWTDSLLEYQTPAERAAQQQQESAELMKKFLSDLG